MNPGSGVNDPSSAPGAGRLETAFADGEAGGAGLCGVAGRIAT